jgi:transposase
MIEAGTERRGAGWPGRSGIVREFSVMSLRPQVCPTVPEETVRIARASFPKGSRYMCLRDELGAVFDDSRFAGLFPTRGRPAEAP